MGLKVISSIKNDLKGSLTKDVVIQSEGCQKVFLKGEKFDDPDGQDFVDVSGWRKEISINGKVVAVPCPVKIEVRPDGQRVEVTQAALSELLGKEPAKPKVEPKVEKAEPKKPEQK